MKIGGELRIIEIFYGCISGGDAAGLEMLVDENFELIVPNAGGALTGRYIGKQDLWLILSMFSVV